mmetsp:Transcript_31929/g.67127  ORF Transcript_31929/g.67127 Transcript_31929/m.67127 type:complete len:467 (-) Transcript_31929:234-1634(-)|eukprot:CAMPEP_0172326544 /NCGR_PEP_ID=MMETSP1058-20130122/56855_1 /TAXON_ID=83371 /ORGANISM="Detonula confervacea, Strain CCMP 353" /LENGTH=466 /DNA_ID=CAMNT_0013043357 /DNA_START=135 /DNA_END=1535 /DNA_ORIENTATION=+
MNNPLYTAPKLKNAKPVPHIAYQIDYVAVNCGRIVAASKRRIRFKFGYTNTEALSNGLAGQECRGSEHEVIITWSLSSGKQAIAFDQHEVYFDVGDSTQSKISHSWKDEYGHTLQVKVHAANMSTKANPDPYWKQYDLFIDGFSIFRMPKIFEIGVVAKEDVADAPKFAQYSSRASPTQAGQYMNGPDNCMGSILPREEPKKPDPEPVDLLSFDEFDAPAPAVVAAPQVASAQTNVYAPAQVPAAPAPAQFQQEYAPAANQFAAQAPVQFQQDYAPITNQFAVPANPYENSQAQVQNQGFSNNISPTASPGMAQDPSAFYQHAATRYVAPTPMASYSQQPNPVTPPRSSSALVLSQQASTSYGVDGAVNNLVNLDDIFGASAAAPATKESVDAKMQEAYAHKSLGQLQGSNNSNATKPVMNTFNAAPAYQQQHGMYNGYAPQQPPRPQYNNFSQQQPYVQSGFGYQ